MSYVQKWPVLREYTWGIGEVPRDHKSSCLHAEYKKCRAQGSGNVHPLDPREYSGDMYVVVHTSRLDRYILGQVPEMGPSPGAGHVYVVQ